MTRKNRCLNSQRWPKHVWMLFILLTAVPGLVGAATRDAFPPAYDDAGEFVAVEHSDGPKIRYAYRKDGALMEAAADEDGVITWLFEPESFSPLGRVSDKRGAMAVFTDHLGTPLCLTDDAGELACQGVTDTFGRCEVVAGEAGLCPWRFPGQYEDAETGLYYNRFRYYSAEVGGYVSRDPIGLSGGLGVHGYVENPTLWSDPLGLADFFSAQNAQHAARLRTGGAPWPSGLERANMGEGFYSWASSAEAENYKALLERHGANDLEVVKFTIDDSTLESLNTKDLRKLADADVDEWMEEFSHYGSANPHGFDYVVRKTNLGDEHYFSPKAFSKGSCE